ncbi:hypothetical protein EP47_00035 [Legionella norrlandica]|uniref:Uncharacterized protein n=1 Tax=Legionella norrlandica TaxID=1498499 RepID=A0A0A2SU44_9GAMM|nr:hypothetical protein [Legionella norrlandica]KGP64277.1 hypothetical protein EP47_00035 [Legionella norrlandica]
MSECAIISLKPKEKFLMKLKDICEDLLDLDENELNKILDNELLESHTIPVCIPLLTTPEDLYLFVKNNSKILFDFMLTAWPFPIGQWNFNQKNIELFEELVDVKYFPAVCKAIPKPVKNTMDLAVTFAVPTNEFFNYIVESIISKKIILSEKEMTQLEFLLSSGIAIVTNKVGKKENQDIGEYLLELNDSKSYLAPMQEDIVKTLFYFYFKNKDEFPQESSNEFLNKWFNTKTYLGMYMFTDPSIVKNYN